MAYFIGDTLAPDEQVRIRDAEMKIIQTPGLPQDVKAAQIRELYISNGLIPGSFQRQGSQDSSVSDIVGGGVDLRTEVKMLKFFLYMGAFFVLWMVFSQKFPETAHVIHGSFWDMWLALVDQGFALWAKFCAWIDASAVPK